MPGGDGTGPWGRGPMTGRGLGYCGGHFPPAYGRPWGRGMGWGRRRFFEDIPDRIPLERPNYQPYYREPSKEEEKTYLEGVVKDMETELGEIRKRLEELDREK
ncbi:MAG: DUF5320 domain-containing protein [Candidatus Thermoplasmatota archaeon]|nr:DUF5320 domain-containing protein [Candidatus Thermoplasmatota archaeon]